MLEQSPDVIEADIQDSGGQIRDSGAKLYNTGVNFMDSEGQIRDSDSRVMDSGSKIQDSEAETFLSRGQNNPNHTNLGDQIMDSGSKIQDSEAGTPISGDQIMDSGVQNDAETPDTSPKTHCLDCTLKHLGAACVLADEYNSGYAESGILMIGHLHEAGRECGDEALARRLRTIRVEATALIGAEAPIDLVSGVLALARGIVLGDRP